jgi:hypothetical protein
MKRNRWVEEKDKSNKKARLEGSSRSDCGDRIYAQRQLLNSIDESQPTCANYP